MAEQNAESVALGIALDAIQHALSYRQEDAVYQHLVTARDVLLERFGEYDTA